MKKDESLAEYWTDTVAKPLREALTCEVSSAVVTYQNHSTDNIFLDPSIAMMERLLRERHCDPVGICRDAPFNQHRANQYAFVYRYEDELYWCHMPEVCWVSFMQQLTK